MTALACLRIVVDSEPADSEVRDVLAAMVAKVAGAFLDAKWRWPRRFGDIAPFSFLLADSRVTSLDVNELVALSEELQLKLFGTAGGGGVSLATFEGEQEAVTRFAAVDPETLRKVMTEGGVIEGLVGRISHVTPHGARIVSPPHEAGPCPPAAVAAETPASPSPARAVPRAGEPLDVRFRGIWCAPKDSFIGNILSARRGSTRTLYSIVDSRADQPGTDAAEFDLVCLEAAAHVPNDANGLLFLPISFSSAVHPGARGAYMEGLERLSEAQRSRLAATVYDVPRAPSFTAISQLKAFLGPYFSFTDLQTSDPDFQIDAMADRAVNSITLSLPDTNEGSRMAGLGRFMANRESYRRRQIWPAVTNVRTHREVAFCQTLRVPLLSGRGVCDSLREPVGPIKFATSQMPLKA